MDKMLYEGASWSLPLPCPGRCMHIHYQLVVLRPHQPNLRQTVASQLPDASQTTAGRGPKERSDCGGSEPGCPGPIPSHATEPRSPPRLPPRSIATFAGGLLFRRQGISFDSFPILPVNRRPCPLMASSLSPLP
ncbi:hypothetical protein L209DRAFT_368547 [Thermothelomyces heterothallicus CBS 203.75]